MLRVFFISYLPSKLYQSLCFVFHLTEITNSLIGN